jgi:hypothetical protein
MPKKALKRRKPQSERKEALIGVRCTGSQKSTLEAKARRRGLGVSTWMLQLGLSQPDDPTKS